MIGDFKLMAGRPVLGSRYLAYDETSDNVKSYDTLLQNGVWTLVQNFGIEEQDLATALDKIHNNALTREDYQKENIGQYLFKYYEFCSRTTLFYNNKSHKNNDRQFSTTNGMPFNKRCVGNR